MSVPEPPPKPHGDIVPDALIAELQRLRDHHDHHPLNSAFMAAEELVRERDEFGRSKYGQPLMSKDGRSSFEDARQELGDLLQYTFKMRMNGESLEELKLLMLAVNAICQMNIGKGV